MDSNEYQEYKKLAIGTVIRYAAEQGVKLRYSDFEGALGAFTNIINKSSNNPTFIVHISAEGRWEKQLKRAREGFLNYVNARLLPNGDLQFSFTMSELNLIKAKREEVDAGEDKIEKVIRKINKLLSLADEKANPSEHEAISASLAVQKLLSQYNLSMEDVTGEKKEGIEQAVADVPLGKKWKYELATAVADNYACKCYYLGSEQIIFYGYKADVLIARRVFSYLFKVGDKLANQFVRKWREDNFYADGVYNSFVRGFTDGIRKELEKQCTALALIVQPEVKESFKAFTAGFATLNTNLDVNTYEAYSEGLIEGKRAMNAQYLPD